MDDYEFKLPEFQGPIGKLLELIEAKQLEINRVNLAEVTSDFVNHLSTMENVPASVLADFVVVAAKLILIKSHTLLPLAPLAPEEEMEIADLETRLSIYREIRNAEKQMGKIWGKDRIFNREFLKDVPEGFYLTQTIEPKQLLSIIAKLDNEIAVLFPQEEAEKIKLVSLEEKIRELAATINRMMSTSFNDLTKGKDKKEVVVLFLALLHLLKDNIIQIDQSEMFENIKIVSQNNAQ